MTKYVYGNPALTGGQFLSTLSGQPTYAPTEAVDLFGNGATGYYIGTGLGDSINASTGATFSASEAAGNNVFSFGTGLDRFSGGPGVNTFVFNAATGDLAAGANGVFDQIVDFHGAGNGYTPGQDFIDLVGYGAGAYLKFDGYSYQGTPLENQSIQLYDIIGGNGHDYGTFVVQMSDGTNLLGPGDYGEVLCFAAGTRIATPAGEVPVEALAEGDLLLTHGGAALPLVWIGRRTARASRHSAPEAVWPVRVQAHAFAAGVPARDLDLSPLHAVFAEGHLVPVHVLVNGRSIRQVRQETTRYFHLELPRHAVLLADGLPAESYLDTGRRGVFENADTDVSAHPAVARDAYLAGACAPFVEHGPVVERIRLRLLQRLPELGHPEAPAGVLRDVAARAA